MKTYVAYVEINHKNTMKKKHIVSCAESVYGFKFNITQRVKASLGEDASINIVYTAELGTNCVLGDII